MVAETTLKYNVPVDTAALLAEMLADPRYDIPEEVRAIGKSVQFDGTAEPFLPVPFKFAEALSTVKGLEASFAAAIGKERYGIDSPPQVSTDRAALFLTAAFTTTLNGRRGLDPALRQYVVDTDIKDSYKHPIRQLCTNIYRTGTGRYFNLHGSLDAAPTMAVVGVDHSRTDITDRQEVLALYKEAVAKWDPAELDRVVNEKARQAGTQCYSWEEFQELEHGKAIKDCPLYELSCAAPSAPVPWPKSSGKGALSGIKVLELTRIIAAPVVGRGLAEHGASVLRIVSDTLPDMYFVHPFMNQGKHVANLNLKTEAGRDKLKELIADCDVFINGYRPGALDKLGFSREEVRAIAPNAVYVRENCYGFHGPWEYRSGWQQIADGLVGVSHALGERLGLGDERGVEPVVPLFPNADFGCGAAGIAGVLHALYLRATKGGVYNLDLALAYYNMWIMQLGQYDDDQWERCRPTVPLDHTMEMTHVLPLILPVLEERNPGLFTSPKLWKTMPAPSFGPGAEVKTPRPAVQIDGLVIDTLRGPVQNGSDPAEWPAA